MPERITVTQRSYCYSWSPKNFVVLCSWKKLKKICDGGGRKTLATKRQISEHVSAWQNNQAYTFW